MECKSFASGFINLPLDLRESVQPVLNSICVETSPMFGGAKVPFITCAFELPNAYISSGLLRLGPLSAHLIVPLYGVAVLKVSVGHIWP